MTGTKKRRRKGSVADEVLEKLEGNNHQDHQGHAQDRIELDITSTTEKTTMMGVHDP
ncbi:hypothetical protein J6590_056409 [Homalodisca vitripennis]|nr:hypothetical protein J6590_056409 [Homalodisca vitripennis]